MNHHVKAISNTPAEATTEIAGSVKVEFYAELLYAIEPVMEAKEDATTTSS